MKTYALICRWDEPVALVPFDFADECVDVHDRDDCAMRAVLSYCETSRSLAGFNVWMSDEEPGYPVPIVCVPSTAKECGCLVPRFEIFSLATRQGQTAFDLAVQLNFRGLESADDESDRMN